MKHVIVRQKCNRKLFFTLLFYVTGTEVIRCVSNAGSFTCKTIFNIFNIFILFSINRAEVLHNQRYQFMHIFSSNKSLPKVKRSFFYQ